VSETDLIGAIAIGFCAGVSSGMLGIGGGVLFVPGLVFFLSQGQLEAEATSLLAIIPVAFVGAYRQRGYGNLRLRDGVLVGVLSVPGAVGGAALADAIDERALELMFAGVQLFFAWTLARRALGTQNGYKPGYGEEDPGARL
jgi:uncharacterized membrane protein YfcA